MIKDDTEDPSKAQSRLSTESAVRAKVLLNRKEDQSTHWVGVISHWNDYLAESLTESRTWTLHSHNLNWALDAGMRWQLIFTRHFCSARCLGSWVVEWDRWTGWAMPHLVPKA